MTYSKACRRCGESFEAPNRWSPRAFCDECLPIQRSIVGSRREAPPLSTASINRMLDAADRKAWGFTPPWEP